jgi:hypothetical protein
MNYVETPRSTLDPPWSERNKVIGSYIDMNTNVLDLGCGHKDLLKYIKPKKYIGIDFNDQADIKINFNLEFSLPRDEWNFIVCSGLLEYLNDVPAFINKIKKTSNKYIITYWSKNEQLRKPNGLEKFSVSDFLDLINQHFIIIEKNSWNNHQILILKDIM